MRFRVLSILALALGVIGLVLVASRNSHRSPEVTNASITNAPRERQGGFRRSARVSSLADEDVAAPAASGTASNLLQGLMAGELDLQLTPEQTAEYLRQYGTNAETLLATQKRDYLKLAAELFPNDPRVQYAVVTRDLFPEARREWLDRFKQSAPDNAMASYLSARDYLRAGDREQGLKDFAEAASKPHFNDYTVEQVQNMEDAQLSAGRSLLEAKLAGGELLLPQLAMFKGLAQDVQAIQKEYLGAGDMASAETLAQLGRVLGQQLSSGEGSRTLIGQLVGVSVERIVLNQLPLDSRPEFLGGSTVQQRFDEIAAFRQNVKTLTPQLNELMVRGNETEIISYFERMKLLGEYKAMLWLQNRNNLR
jgi:hypothetical protein